MGVCVPGGLRGYPVLNVDIISRTRSVRNSAIYVIGSLIEVVIAARHLAKRALNFFVARHKSGFTVHRKWSGNLRPRAIVTQIQNAQITSCRVARVSKHNGRLRGA